MGFWCGHGWALPLGSSLPLRWHSPVTSQPPCETKTQGSGNYAGQSESGRTGPKETRIPFSCANYHHSDGQGGLQDLPVVDWMNYRTHTRLLATLPPLTIFASQVSVLGNTIKDYTFTVARHAGRLLLILNSLAKKLKFTFPLILIGVLSAT